MTGPIAGRDFDPQRPTWIQLIRIICSMTAMTLHNWPRPEHRFARVLGPYLVVVTATALAHACRGRPAVTGDWWQAVMVLMALSGPVSSASVGWFDETLELGGRTTAGGR